MHCRQPRIGDAALFARMENPGLLINGHESPYGYGLIRDQVKGQKTVGHGGWIAGARSESVYYKDHDLTIIILANHDDFSPYLLARSIAGKLIGFEEESRFVAANLAEGTYREDHGEDVFKIEKRQGKPYFVTNMGAAPLVADSEKSYKPQSALAPFTLHPEEDGSLLAERFGSIRRFVPIRSVDCPIETYAQRSFQARREELFIQTYCVEDVLHLSITSPEGMVRLRLDDYYGEGYFLAHPSAMEAHDQWRVCPWLLPWLFSVHIRDHELVINSDRTKNLVFEEL